MRNRKIDAAFPLAPPSHPHTASLRSDTGVNMDQAVEVVRRSSCGRAISNCASQTYSVARLSSRAYVFFPHDEHRLVEKNWAPSICASAQRRTSSATPGTSVTASIRRIAAITMRRAPFNCCCRWRAGTNSIRCGSPAIRRMEPHGAVLRSPARSSWKSSMYPQSAAFANMAASCASAGIGCSRDPRKSQRVPAHWRHHRPGRNIAICEAGAGNSSGNHTRLKSVSDTGGATLPAGSRLNSERRTDPQIAVRRRLDH